MVVVYFYGRSNDLVGLNWVVGSAREGERKVVRVSSIKCWHLWSKGMSRSHRRAAFITTWGTLPCARERLRCRETGTWKLKALNSTLPVATCLVDRSKALFLSIIFRFYVTRGWKASRGRRYEFRPKYDEDYASVGQRIFDGIHTSSLSTFSARCVYPIYRSRRSRTRPLKSQVYHIRYKIYTLSTCGFRGAASSQFLSVTIGK